MVLSKRIGHHEVPWAMAQILKCKMPFNQINFAMDIQMLKLKMVILQDKKDFLH